jgi:hypothetical protein
MKMLTEERVRQGLLREMLLLLQDGLVMLKHWFPEAVCLPLRILTDRLRLLAECKRFKLI